MNSVVTPDTMQLQLQNLRQAQRQAGIPDASTRKDRLQRAVNLLVENQDILASTLDEDYGGRSPYLTKMSDIMMPVGHLKHAIKHVDRWMKPEKRSAAFPMGLLGGRARIEFQPLGVVGIMSPWNFPMAMIFNPLATALAAGNRAMIKPSEFNPKTADLLEKLFAAYFSDDEVVVVNGGPEAGGAFAALDLDHILFTGATSIGRMVMQAAAQNLTPVTLELGGKSPTIVSPSADLKKSAETIISGKIMNAGQVCLSPDYVFVPEGELENFVKTARDTFQEMFPTVKGNHDYVAVVNDRHYDRISGYIDEAKQAGARVESMSDDAYTAEEQRIPLHLVINPAEELRVMQDEIFGPVMIVKTYTKLSECIDYIADHPHPLGLYYFGSDKAEQEYVLNNTQSGGVTINDVIMHVSNIDLPFGGVGNSGMGNYQGVEGFRTFSHARSIYTQGWVNLPKLAGTLPPYNTAKLDKLFAGQIKK